ncbi:uncharacterized [Tachysurus ichikawai]
MMATAYAEANRSEGAKPAGISSAERPGPRSSRMPATLHQSRNLIHAYMHTQTVTLEPLLPPTQPGMSS